MFQSFVFDSFVLFPNILHQVKTHRFYQYIFIVVVVVVYVYGCLWRVDLFVIWIKSVNLSLFLSFVRFFLTCMCNLICVADKMTKSNRKYCVTGPPRAVYSLWCVWKDIDVQIFTIYYFFFFILMISSRACAFLFVIPYITIHIIGFINLSFFIIIFLPFSYIFFVNFPFFFFV